MNKAARIALILWTVLMTSGLFSFRKDPVTDPRIVSYVADPRMVRLYWKDAQGHILGSLQRLKDFEQTQKHTLVFAMNGGMYREDQSPLGLYIEDYRKIMPVNTVQHSYGNFYLQPNGIFYVTKDGRANVCRTRDFRQSPAIRYATQSGPMLVIDGRIQARFRQGSANVNVRNGVGILPDGSVLFALSKSEINFYDFADYFRKAGCRNALYLDGFVSRAYAPQQQWVQTEGRFGVMIGVVRP